jgi:nicotinamide mononucleotide adenylyltransferase
MNPMALVEHHRLHNRTLNRHRTTDYLTATIRMAMLQKKMMRTHLHLKTITTTMMTMTMTTVKRIFLFMDQRRTHEGTQ